MGIRIKDDLGWWKFAAGWLPSCGSMVAFEYYRRGQIIHECSLIMIPTEEQCAVTTGIGTHTHLAPNLWGVQWPEPNAFSEHGLLMFPAHKKIYGEGHSVSTLVQIGAASDG